MSASRFEAATAAARNLPGDLLSQAQKLKLYALYKQIEQGPAPASAPPGLSALARAKWEAWGDVRGLSKDEAMESYCSIIETLVEMCADDPADASTSTAAAPPAPAPSRAAPARATPARATPARAKAPAPSNQEPTVERVTWQTSAITVAAGATTTVPLVASEPSLVKYALSTTSGGPLLLTIFAANDAASASLGESDGEGEVETGAGLVRVVLDNSAATFSTAVVACTVTLEPLAQLAVRAAYDARQRRMHLAEEALIAAHAFAFDRVAQQLARERSMLDAARGHGQGDLNWYTNGWLREQIAARQRDGEKLLAALDEYEEACA